MENVPGEELEVTQIEHTTDNKHVILDTYQSIMLDLSSFWDFWISSSFCKPETPLITYHCMFHVLLPLIFWHLMLSGLEPTSGVLWISVTYTQTKTNTDIQTFETNQMLRISVMLEDFGAAFLLLKKWRTTTSLLQHLHPSSTVTLQISPARYIFRPSLRTHQNSTRIH